MKRVCREAFQKLRLFSRWLWRWFVITRAWNFVSMFAFVQTWGTVSLVGMWLLAFGVRAWQLGFGSIWAQLLFIGAHRGIANIISMLWVGNCGCGWSGVNCIHIVTPMWMRCSLCQSLRKRPFLVKQSWKGVHLMVHASVQLYQEKIELYELKTVTVMFKQFLRFHSCPGACESLWNKCMASIVQACKRLCTI